MLSNLELPPEIEKHRGDVVAGFYLPALRAATRYDRLTGYFASSVFTLLWSGLRDFITRGGTIRIVCSPALSDRDIEGLDRGYAARNEDELAAELRDELETMLTNPHLRDAALALAALIVAGHVDVRIAVPEELPAASTKRMFHDKVGVFSDDAGNKVSFRGSMNETFLGLAGAGHTESIDIHPSWEGGRDEARADAADQRFERIWHDREQGLRVRPLPAVTLEELRAAADGRPWEEYVDHLVASEDAPAYEAVEPEVDGHPLRDHQVAAWKAWEDAGRVGILKHATGAGKTYTGIWVIKQALRDGLVPLVLVPKRLLLRQWYADITAAIPEARVLRCGDGHNTWKTERHLNLWLTASADTPRIFIATLSTATSPEFLREFRRRENVLIIADEVHSTGSRHNQAIYQLAASARLGLSATPERYGDPEGTAALFDFFGQVCHSYTLADAISDRVLTPYRYYPQVIELTDSEQEEWDDLTAQIRRRAGRLLSSDADGAMSDERLKFLLIQRARIVKKAEGKTAYAARLVNNQFEDGQRWLVYCEDQEHLQHVRAAIEATGLPTLEYHTSMTGDEQATLRAFEHVGGVLVSIKCLDEGVDIPAATHALILSSSKNPREFIQRRGRVLRKAPNKNVAHLHDTVVVPSTVSEEHQADRLVLAELMRAMEFTNWATNSTSAKQPLEDLFLDRGYDIQLLVEAGEEADDEDGGAATDE